mgnify:CR=1 FL=1
MSLLDSREFVIFVLFYSSWDYLSIIICIFNKMKFNRRQITGYFLTGLFVFYFASISFFSHVHVDGYNRLIVHSHPFSSESHHQHSTVNFQTIDRLQNFTIHLLFLAISFIAIYRLSFISSDPYRKGFHLSVFSSFCFLRPPPVLK